MKGVFLMSIIAVENVNLISGNDDDGVLNNVTILIENKFIKKVKKTPQISFDRNSYKIVDATDKWLMPGLINCHDHLFNKNWGNLSSNIERKAWQMEFFLRSPGYQALESAKNSWEELKQGVTTIRDLGGPSVKNQKSPNYTNVDLRKAIESGLCGPRILACRLAINITGGHGYPWYGIREADGTNEVRKAVREQLKGGADCIKIMSGGGFANYPEEDPNFEEFSIEEIKVAVEEAHKREKLVTAHAISSKAAKNAILAGVDTIEHGFMIDEETVRLMFENNVSFVPTMIVPLKILQRDASPLHSLIKGIVPEHKKIVLLAKKLGVMIGVGTDSGYKMYEELEALIECGFSPLEALVLATKSSAKICGLENVGIIQEGKIADVILLEKNPLKDIKKAFDNVQMVIKEGQVIYLKDGNLNT